MSRKWAQCSRLASLHPTPLPAADAPRLDDSDCPRSWTWPEGPEQTLRCEARGNPAPSVHCARTDGGAVLALGLLGPVTRALAGTYRCTAANAQGEAVKDVTLTVECEWGCAGRISGSWRLGVASLQGRVGAGPGRCLGAAFREREENVERDSGRISQEDGGKR